MPATAKNQAPATGFQQPANQTATDDQEIVFTHSYSPGHSYRISLPGAWQGKYSVKETKNQLGEGLVTFSYDKPVYYNAREISFATMGDFTTADDIPVPTVSTKNRNTQKNSVQMPGGLREIVSLGAAKGIPPAQSLKDAGVRKPASQFIEGEFNSKK